jgi:hypothetical protein
MRSNPGPPMSLANMRENGLRSVIAQCESCNHSADVNVDAMPETVFVPHVARRLRCSHCGGKAINTSVNRRRTLTLDWSGPLGADRDQAADLTPCRAWWSSNCLGLR